MTEQMDDSFDNPFGVTRAADFTDEQIFQYWVDLVSGGGFLDLIQPRLEMPMLILGGKGSGKTHIMRYLSFPLQKLRHSTHLVKGISDEGYLGIYMRCSGLNSARFRGKGQLNETWVDVFAYYMELWLAQLVVNISCELLIDSSSVANNERTIIAKVKDLFDAPAREFPENLQDLSRHLRQLQKELDVAINNCALDGVLDITIRATSGRLVFGIPQVLASHLPEMRDILFVYLIDEFENLTEPQQKLINTLIREKQNPCSFKVGAKPFGVRTYSTYCADEDNREGSEYERLPLDVELRKDETVFAAFARRLVIRRLVTRGILTNPPESDDEMEEFLSAAFEQTPTEGLAEQATQFVIEKYSDRERPYFKILRQVLQQGMKADVTPGVSSGDDIDSVAQLLACPEFPLLEKLNCFIFYQQWESNRNLLESADTIHRDCQTYVSERDKTMQYHDKLLHWKYDLLAQLRRESDQKQQYAGFDTFIKLSWGNPRHLLIILKHVLSWGAFKDERPFGEKPVSVKAQTDGVKEAADWFFGDARMPGKDGRLIQDAISRLGTLFRSIRYSHKPSECSLSTFSYEPASVSTETNRLIDLAEKYLLLVYVGGQPDRNSERVDRKCQLNRMLGPLWDISFSRRGALVIPGDDLNAIFDPAFTADFEQLLKVRVDRMTAPFFGGRRRDNTSKDQGRLFGMGDD
jgi:hypothetical protein